MQSLNAPVFALVRTQVGWTVCSNVRSWFNKDLFTINNHCETQNINARTCFQKLIVMYYVTIIHLVKFMVFPWTHKHTPLWWSTARTICSMIPNVTTWVACLFPCGKRLTDRPMLWQMLTNWTEATLTRQRKKYDVTYPVMIESFYTVMSCAITAQILRIFF